MAILMSDLCEKGVKLLWFQCDSKRYPEGISYLEQAIQAGDPEACFFLGRCYSWGDGNVQDDDKKARQLYLQGAEQGSYRCLLGAKRAQQYDLELRRRAVHTLEEAFTAVKQAAEEGEGFAAYQIGCFYYWGDCYSLKGIGGEDQCMGWFERAGEAGVAASMRNAGSCWFNGEHCEKNKERYAYWVKKAAQMGSPWGVQGMGFVCRDEGRGEEAVEWFSRSAAAGDSSAYYQIGWIYKRGEIVQKDYFRAADAFAEGMKRGDTDCLVGYADACFHGRGVPEDNAQARTLYEQAYSRGNRNVCQNLGYLYLHQEPKNEQRARELFEQVAEKNGYACYQLGFIYEKGRGVPENCETAMEHYRAGAALGNSDCAERLTHFKKTLFGKWKYKK